MDSTLKYSFPSYSNSRFLNNPVEATTAKMKSRGFEVPEITETNGISNERVGNILHQNCAW